MRDNGRFKNFRYRDCFVVKFKRDWFRFVLGMIGQEDVVVAVVSSQTRNLLIVLAPVWIAP